MIKALGDVFVPILPAIVASGLMMGLVEALGKALPAFAASDWYGILDLLANTAFVFLPVLIAVSAARVFGGNIFLGAVIGMIMIHPNLVNAWSVGSMDPAEIPVWHLFGFSIRQVGYQGHVIPVIIAVWLMCQLERWLHKHVPEMIDLFVTPLCTVLLTAFLTLGLIGPVFSTAENYVLSFEPEKASEAPENSGASSQEIPVVLPEKIEEKTLYAPVKGNVIARDQIPDETFASGVLGDGVGIEPEVGLVVAPCDGEIASLTDSRHAIGIVGAGGMEILIHVGIDTVNMQGDGFGLLVSMGEKVKAGQKLLHFGLEKIKAAGYSTTTAVLVANSFMFPGFQVERTGKTELMEKLISTE